MNFCLSNSRIFKKMNRITTLFHLVYNQFLHSICTYNLESLINFLNNLAIILSQYPNSSLAFYIQILHKLFSLFNPQHSRVFDVILLVNHPFIRWFSRVYTTGYPCCDFCYFLLLGDNYPIFLNNFLLDFLKFFFLADKILKLWPDFFQHFKMLTFLLNFSSCFVNVCLHVSYFWVDSSFKSFDVKLVKGLLAKITRLIFFWLLINLVVEILSSILHYHLFLFHYVNFLGNTFI